nr:hypothetical protein Iba_chr04dCG4870 [Ipomoea batatas]GMC88298.1 hypothetical protein Iba_chr04eCG8770 [Ipomoea batatas]
MRNCCKKLRFCNICSLSTMFEIHHLLIITLKFCNPVYGCMENMTKKQSDYKDSYGCSYCCPGRRAFLLKPAMHLVPPSWISKIKIDNMN